MGKNSVRRPRGTRDFGPGEMQTWRQVEVILRRTATEFGYREVATPTFEHLDLFTGKSGEEIIDQLYTFEDKGGRTMALRPELTAAVLRFFSEEMAFLPKPVKVFYFGNCFRYERPQKGRYREFWQFGAECIGTDTGEAAGEIIALAHRSIQATGLRKCVLRIGHLGILKGLLERLWANDKAVMTLIDKGNTEGLVDYFTDNGLTDVKLLVDMLGLITDPKALEKGRSMLLGAERISEVNGGENGEAGMTGFEETGIDDDHDIESGPRPMWREMVREGFESLERVSAMLERSGIRHIIDYGIARGLDYYTGIVFEIDVPSLGAEKQICGGGEYNLNDLFSMNIKGTSGFAVGFDRLRMALEGEGVSFPETRPMVGIIPTQGTADTAFVISMELRRSGIGTDLEVSGRGLKKALSRMNDIGVKFTIIIGESELADGKVVVRDMTSGDQEEIELNAVKEHFLHIIEG